MAGRSVFHRPIGRVHLAFVFALLAVGIWSLVSPPGLYDGSLSGRFTLESNETGEFRIVLIQAESAPAWRWCFHGLAFQYPAVRVHVVAPSPERTMVVEFPGPRYNPEATSEPLVEETFLDFIAGSDPSLRQQGKVFFEFVKSVGNGKAPRTRHHGYSVDEPYCGRFTHFGGGTPAGVFLLCAIACAWLVVALMRRRRRTPAAAR